MIINQNSNDYQNYNTNIISSFSYSQFSLCDCLCTHPLHIWTLQLPSLDLQGTISNTVIDWLRDWHKFSGPITE